jgi:hypothetical protein
LCCVFDFDFDFDFDMCRVSTPDNAVVVEGVENFNRKERKVKGVDL